MSLDPVCVIHGKAWSEHEGGRCLYCCICYRPLTPDGCATDGNGQKWDVCKGSCAHEAGFDLSEEREPVSDHFVYTEEYADPDNPLIAARRWRAECAELQSRIDAALVILGAAGATNWEKVQAVGLILSTTPSAPTAAPT